MSQDMPFLCESQKFVFSGVSVFGGKISVS